MIRPSWASRPTLILFLGLIGGCALIGGTDDPEELDADGDGWRPIDGDCDDGDPAVNPGAPELPDNGKDDDCVGGDEITPIDNDGDGVIAAEDCDDEDRNNSPDRSEWCDGQDNDCDGDIDEGFDADGDGVSSCGPDGEDDNADDDCDDGDADSYPGADERCDAVDTDCDGTLDEDYDQDDDGATSCGPDGVPGTADDDCDDNDDTIVPGLWDGCDGIDNNCNGLIDEDDSGADLDGDGYGSCDGGAPADCDDQNPEVHPGATESCDGQDDDCDGLVDEGFDADGDGVKTCEGDCDDGDPGTNPQAVDFPGNGVDEDCDGADQISNCVGPLASATEGEPNNSTSQADVVPAGTARFATLNGAINCAGDEDWFELHFACGGPMTFELDWDGSNSNLGLRVDQGGTIAAITGPITFGPVSTSGAAATGTFLVQVTCAAGVATNWELTIDWD